MCAWIRTPWRSLNRFHSHLGLRLLARVFLFSSVITLLLTSLQLYFEYRRDVGTIDRRISEIEESYRRSLSEGLWNLDSRQLELQVDGILHLPDIRFVEVREATDGADAMVVSAGVRQTNAEVHREFPIFRTFRGTEQQLGVLSIEATLNEVYHHLFDTAIVILGTQGVKTFAVSFLSSLSSTGSSHAILPRWQKRSAGTVSAVRRHHHSDCIVVRLGNRTSLTSSSERSTACARACKSPTTSYATTSSS